MHPKSVTFNEDELSNLRTVVWWLMMAEKPTRAFWLSRISEEIAECDRELFLDKLSAIGLLVEG